MSKHKTARSHPLAQAAESLAPGWRSRLSHEFSKPYMEKLAQYLETEITAGEVILPQADRLFRALNFVDYDAVRVVILGQDPYPTPGHANGLAFAVDEGVRTPGSLRNIFKEITADLGETPRSPTLEGWAKQGVLLLNTVLTVRAGQSLSHRGQGWETFTSQVLQQLNQHPQPLVFLLWGQPAWKTAAPLITEARHIKLAAPHPSPLSAHRGFLGCRHFSKTNEILQKHSAIIEWTNS